MPALVDASPAPTPRLHSIAGTPKSRSLKAKPPSLMAQHVQIAHQQINVDILFQQKKLSGYTELTVIPTSANLRSLRLDARQMTITKILFNGSQLTDFIHKDQLYINDPDTFEEYARRKVPNVWDEYLRDFSIHQHHLLRQKLSYIFGHLDEQQLLAPHFNPNTEELMIFFPEKYRIEAAEGAIHHTPGSVRPPASTTTPLQLRLKNSSADVYAPIQIGIYYEVVNPKNGLNFVASDALDRSLWHVYTTNSDHNVSASSWVPCIDNLLQRSSWSLELSIPRSVRDIFHNTPSGEDDDEENRDLVVCSGDFVNAKESPHPSDLLKKVVSWTIFNPICAHHIGFAIGAFQSTELAHFEDATGANDDMDEDLEGLEKDDSQVPVLLYYLPGEETVVRNTCIFTQQAVEYFLKEYGSYPFSSYGIVMVHDTTYPRSNFAGLSLFSSDLSYPENVIEPMFTVTEEILDCIAGQWSGISIVPLTLNDMWCTIGIAKYMTMQFTRTLMGSNECRYQIRKRMDAIVEQDVGQCPLGAQVLEAPVSESNFDFLRLKAPIILFILDRRMTKTDKSFGFSRVLPKLFLQAMSGDMQNGALSTMHFQYVCEKVNRNRLEAFFKQWVYGVGAPIFNITQKFNKKRSMIEVIIRQLQLQQFQSPQPKADTFMRDAVNYLNDEQSYPVQQTFLGPMTLRVHEADGTPYEHIVDIKDSVVKFDVQYNTKYKRLKKNKEDGEELVFSKLGDILGSPADMRDWKFEDWPKRDEEFFDPFEWIRVDADFEWIATMRVNQPDYMYGAQLQQDRDIEAQLAAIEYFGAQEKPSRIYCTMLTRTLLDSRYFYGVRIAAAKALAGFSTQANHFIGLDYLIRAFRQMFCFENSYIPKSNDFQDFGDFFLQKAIPLFLARVKDDNGNSPPVTRGLLYNLLKYNDNSSNDFQDCFYITTLVESVVQSVVHEVPTNIDFHLEKELHKDRGTKFLRKVVEEINRIHKLDRHVPSYHMTISVACLEQKIHLARCNLYDLSFEDLLHLTHCKNDKQTRLAAFKGLFLLGGLKNGEILRYFLHVCLLEKTSSSFRSALIRVLADSISEAAIHGNPSMLDDPEFKSLEAFFDKKRNLGNMVIVEESHSLEMNLRRDALAKATVKGLISILRRDLAIGVGLQKTLWELLHLSLLSLGDKKTVFLLCEVLYDAVSCFPVHIPVPCVSFEELKKKIVAKNLGDGKVVIKREGRFRIQLSTRLSLDNPKLKLKMDRQRGRKPETQVDSNAGGSTDLEGTQEQSQAQAVIEQPQKHLEPESQSESKTQSIKDSESQSHDQPGPSPEKKRLQQQPVMQPENQARVIQTQENDTYADLHALGADESQLEEIPKTDPVQSKTQDSAVRLSLAVTRDLLNPMMLTFSFSKETLAERRPAPVSVNGGIVKIRIRPLRYIRINTMQNLVTASRVPFETNSESGTGKRRRGGKNAKQFEEFEENKMIEEAEGRSHNHRRTQEGTPVKAPVVEVLEEEEPESKNIGSPRDLKSKVSRSLRESDARSTSIRRETEARNVDGRTTDARISRAASPFSEEPLKMPKKKKKIYIHSRSSTPNPEGPEKEPRDKTGKWKNEDLGELPKSQEEGNGDKDAYAKQNPEQSLEPSSKQGKPKQKLKLKFSLK